ncbi:MAG TPA: hydrolase TatD [Porticoccaceae bacterium]|nr:hydrolase TatD [Porticoccaceae bacterium]HCO61527.1 hydrolase TatD [Porticoccaceae bacterium]
MIAPHPLVDIGLNLSSKQFHGDQSTVLERALTAGVDTCILTGTSESTSAEVLALCQQFADKFPSMLYCTAGVHPHEARHWTAHTRAALETCLTAPQTVAIGECGLDFNRDFSPRDAQQQVFEAQLELASAIGKPLFMHERDAHQRQHEILKCYRDNFDRGVIHCFTGERQALFNYLDLDLHIGITGWVCDERRGAELRELIPEIPLNRLMIETDAPYLIPRTIRPRPKSRRNEPAFLPWVLTTIAELRHESPADLAKATRKTSLEFFGILANSPTPQTQEPAA